MSQVQELTILNYTGRFCKFQNKDYKPVGRANAYPLDTGMKIKDIPKPQAGVLILVPYYMIDKDIERRRDLIFSDNPKEFLNDALV